MSVLSFFGFDKVTKFFNLLKSNGGPVNAFLISLRTDDLKEGKLVGEDKYGNKYYQNDYYFYGKNRWIIYSPKYGLDYDASQIPAEWFGWLHYKTDLLPGEDKSRAKYKWMAEHEENLSGTPKQYVPYSTCTRKIESWIPPKSNK